MAPRRKRYLRVAIVAAVFLALGLLAWRLYNPPALYRMTILPSLGGLGTEAQSLNDHGQVVGLVYDWRGSRPFLWDHKHGIQDLGPIGEYGMLINNAGQISGLTSTDPNGHAFMWEPAKGRTMLGSLGGKGGLPTGINNRGQIIGLANDAAYSTQAFLWDKETGIRKLTTPDGSPCQAMSINDVGQVLVMSIGQTRTPPRWFLFDPNGWRSLDPVPPRTWPHSINAHSCIAAVKDLSLSAAYLVLRDEQGAWRRLFRMNDHNEMTRLNNKDQIAYTESSRTRWRRVRDRLPRWLARRFPSHGRESYLWDPVRGRIPLDRYLKGITEFHVEDLNNNGCIIGRGNREDGSVCSVLLEPIPERWSK